MLSQEQLEEKIRSIKPSLEQEFGVDKIGYFGSYASNSQTENSDLDILVDFSKDIGWKFFDLKDYLEDVFGLKVDLVTPRSIRKSWKESIQNQVRYL
ncbi:MAG: nucleotidyltransferase family protein [Cyclobacteriaceae bacterium]